MTRLEKNKTKMIFIYEKLYSSPINKIVNHVINTLKSVFLLTGKTSLVKKENHTPPPPPWY